MPTCSHDEIQFAPRAIEPSPGMLLALIQVRCGTCQQQFRWLGLDAGQANANLPVVSADGFELRAPLAFGPGNHVGLLEQLGLADRLVEAPDL